MGLEDIMVYIHPPIAIAAYAFILMNTIFTLGGKASDRALWTTSATGWLLTTGGLVTGMIWAELAWGTYWNWDPKETANLLLFMSVSFYIMALENPKGRKWLRGIAVADLVLVFVTLFISRVMESLHAHY